MDASAGLSANLTAKLIHPKAPARVYQARVPWLGRLMFTRDPGDARQTAAQYLQTRLHAAHFDGDGKLKDQYDLGSGFVQQQFVVALMQDTVGTTSNKAAPILANANKYMYSGTGTIAYPFDIQLGTSIALTTSSLTPTLAYSADNTTLQYVGTINYNNTYAVTEWGLFNTNSQGAFSTSTTNTFTAQTIATATWGTSLGTANAEAGWTVYQSSASVGGFILSHSAGGTAASVVTAVSPTTGWYSTTNAGGVASTPSTNTSTSVYPFMSDHKTFSALNVVSSDSIQFTYTLTIQSGG